MLQVMAWLTWCVLRGAVVGFNVWVVLRHTNEHLLAPKKCSNKENATLVMPRV